MPGCVCHFLRRRYATQFLVHLNRGLKSTAAVMPSLREGMQLSRLGRQAGCLLMPRTL